MSDASSHSSFGVDGSAGEEAREDGHLGSSGLSHQMRTLSDVIRHLEEQLDRVIASNDALKRDLADERQRRLDLEDEASRLRERLRRGEQEMAGRENLVAETQHANHERARLAAAMRELAQRLEREEEQHRAKSRLVERLQVSRKDALEELQSVESQFDRAMQMIADSQAQLTIASEEREALAGRLKVTEERLRQSEIERSHLLEEVEQSRDALDDIRRSLVDACVVSAASVGDDEGADGGP